ncbi:PepSY domain-containing protein [Thauera linaloolentis]|uniref:Propeptide PepSY amd peptidase M4 n=1 Tax=Thauera linaloolentis (strain DSM 12138 / JCM 21573 / CCUG 41526 / CIP 105981 / IAM 15112 / NBRC 102519 / 47Lol) TaxID=1123367 RepID=N6YXE7_THAL4|nr:PepSY domain-containing protein [Thauera linaloolentis]ENO87082.1 Propeptide PepSY amd peptidase M4 [Thauera linaloolentis 47Lol = DSM 12138]MCM8565519.1 PepSY domain-containing protein [Thauera linaloolentis]
MHTRQAPIPPSRIRQAIAAAVTSLAIATLAATGLQPAAAHASDDRARASEVRQLRESGKILPMEDILTRSRAAQPGQVVEVELDRERGSYVYEVKIIDTNDRVHKLDIDAASGEVLRRETK